jgi:hypothetical protein
MAKAFDASVSMECSLDCCMLSQYYNIVGCGDGCMLLRWVMYDGGLTTTRRDAPNKDLNEMLLFEAVSLFADRDRHRCISYSPLEHDIGRWSQMRVQRRCMDLCKGSSMHEIATRMGCCCKPLLLI